MVAGDPEGAARALRDDMRRLQNYKQFVNA